MTGVPQQRDSDRPGVASAHSARPAYGAQPSKTDRPVPLRHSDEAPSDPEQWDSSSTEPSGPRGTDDIKDDRVRAERESRADLADAPDDDESRSDGTSESSYPSEREQGAAQPGAVDRADDEGSQS